MIEKTMFQQANLGAIKKALTVYASRHRVVAENIANIETAGYRTQEYRFEEYLDTARQKLHGLRTHPRHLPIGRHSLDETTGSVAETGSKYDNGINNVDIDQEMAGLATNDLAYRLATRLLSMKYDLLRGAITGHVR